MGLGRSQNQENRINGRERMNISEIEPIIDKVSLLYEFYDDYSKRMEIELNRILLGIINDPIDIRLYHKLYADLQNEDKKGKFKTDKSTAQRFMNLLKKYGIEIHVLAKTSESEGWHLPIWRIFKDNELIAEV